VHVQCRAGHSGAQLGTAGHSSVQLGTARMLFRFIQNLSLRNKRFFMSLVGGGGWGFNFFLNALQYSYLYVCSLLVAAFTRSHMMLTARTAVCWQHGNHLKLHSWHKPRKCGPISHLADNEEYQYTRRHTRCQLHAVPYS
jgi:hypothetical protein